MNIKIYNKIYLHKIIIWLTLFKTHKIKIEQIMTIIKNSQF